MIIDTDFKSKIECMKFKKKLEAYNIIEKLSRMLPKQVNIY